MKDMLICKKLLKIIIAFSLLCVLFPGKEVNATHSFPKFKKGTTGLTFKNNDFYLLDENSNIKTGWQNHGGNLYYFSKKNGKMFVGIKKIGNDYYYFDENGCCVPDVAFSKNMSLKHGFYITDNETRYYFNGSMLKGFAQIDGVNYYFDEETGVMQDFEKALSEYRKEFADNSNSEKTEQPESPYVTVHNTVMHSTYNSDKNNDERTLLAAIIYCEAGNQKHFPYKTIDGKTVYKGMLAVGYVIANRVTDNLGIKEVIYRKNMFQPTRNGRLTDMLNNPQKISADAFNAADVVLYYIHNNIESVPEYPVSNFKWGNFWGRKYAEHLTNFFSVFKGDNEYEIIQDHIFFNYKMSLKANK